MQAIPYLNFDGDCKEAFEFYQQLLGGELSVQSHGDSAIADEVGPEWQDLVLHAYLKSGDLVLMASDAPPDRYEKPQGLYVSLGVDSPEEADRVFGALAEDGRVTMPIEETFWSPRFGMLVDRFGIPWMVNCWPAETTGPSRS